MGSDPASDSISDWRQRLRRFVQTDLWSAEAMARHGLERFQGLLQFAVAVAQGVQRDMLLLRASALTYYTLLSIVPLLAFALSIAEGVGVEVSENLIALAVRQLAPGNSEAVARLVAIVREVDFASLGTVGATILFATTVLSIRSIESTLNTIWGLTHDRRWERRIADYLAMLVVAPLLVGVSLSVGTTAAFQSLRALELFQVAYDTGLQLAPLFFLWAGFSFLYWFLPNTRVRVAPALVGGLVAALLFVLAQRAYVGLSIGFARYNALYGGLAALPLLLVWIYTSWTIVLLGAEIAAAWENLVHLRRARRGSEPSPAAREAIGLAIAARIARRFESGGEPVDPEELADRLEIPLRSVRSILGDLQAAGLVSPLEERGRTRYQLGRSAERVRVTDVLNALRGPRGGLAALDETPGPVRALLEELDHDVAERLGGRSLAELARAPGGRAGA